jgi:cytochrome c-type biogenesis protein CcmH/NrfF
VTWWAWVVVGLVLFTWVVPFGFVAVELWAVWRLERRAERELAVELDRELDRIMRGLR